MALGRPPETGPQHSALEMRVGNPAGQVYAETTEGKDGDSDFINSPYRSLVGIKFGNAFRPDTLG